MRRSVVEYNTIVRITLYMLKKKKLVHIVPRILVVNVPLLLFYYNVNERSMGKTGTALTSSQIGLRYSRAVELVHEVVSRYSSIFDDLISQLRYFRKLYDKFMNIVVRAQLKKYLRKSLYIEKRRPVLLSLMILVGI